MLSTTAGRPHAAGVAPATGIAPATRRGASRRTGPTRDDRCNGRILERRRDSDGEALDCPLDAHTVEQLLLEFRLLAGGGKRVELSLNQNVNRCDRLAETAEGSRLASGDGGTAGTTRVAPPPHSRWWSGRTRRAANRRKPASYPHNSD